jgi:hypothetical protein
MRSVRVLESQEPSLTRLHVLSQDSAIGQLNSRGLLTTEARLPSLDSYVTFLVLKKLWNNCNYVRVLPSASVKCNSFSA